MYSLLGKSSLSNRIDFGMIGGIFGDDGKGSNQQWKDLMVGNKIEPTANFLWQLRKARNENFDSKSSPVLFLVDKTFR